MMYFLASLLFVFSVPDGTIVDREPYVFPFESHEKWLNFMKGKGLPDWSKLISEEAYGRYHQGKRVRCERIRYSSEGLEITGFLLTPQFGQGQLPAVIYNRGGTAKWGRITFWEILEMFRLAERGHVVIASYLRGVGGSQGKPELGGGDIRDTLALIPLLESLPRVDASRIGMWGFSRGGITTYMTMARTDRISAAVIIAGASDATSGARRPEFETHVYPGVLAGYEQDSEKAMRAISAVHWSGRLPRNTSLLLLHGTADKRVPVSHTLAMAKRLQELQRTYRLVIYENGSHSLAENFLEVRREIDRWLDRYLAGKP